MLSTINPSAILEVFATSIALLQSVAHGTAEHIPPFALPNPTSTSTSVLSQDGTSDFTSSNLGEHLRGPCSDRG